MARKKKELTKRGIMDCYGLTPAMIGRYLPKPRKYHDPHYENAAPVLLWKREDVEKAILEHPELQEEIRKKAERKKNKARSRTQLALDAAAYLEQFSPETIFEEGRQMKRHFVLHIGPTNSGKTFGALQKLREAETGVYLGPLRLLALEVFENLNSDGCPCALLTGEEFIDVPNAGITASTVELANYEEHYDVAVIDEAQMLADRERGPHWTRAICLIDADEVHICLAPEAEQLIVKMMEQLGSDYEIVRQDRLVPLEFSGLFRRITDVKPGDALIVFSRKRVLQLAALLEKEKIRASVIYGALPPASRREEVRRFADKETMVVVATDAIGMGISLPIRRVIFVDTEKFDGESVRPLTPTEVRQIGGRAGRFGKYDLGEVLTMSAPKLIKNAMAKPIDPIEKLTLGFPQEALDYDYPLGDMLKQWDNLPKSELFVREDMHDSEFLLKKLDRIPPETTKAMIYSLITCPLDIKNDRLVAYWKDSCERILTGEEVERPQFRETTLESCELQYHAYDIYHQLLRRIGVEDDCVAEKTRLSEKINKLLRQRKSAFLKRCRICGRELGIHDKFSVCDKCYEENRGYAGRD